MRSLVMISLLALASPGCIAFYSTRPVAVEVSDANTSSPLPDAPVSVSYLYMMVLNAPEPAQARTGPDGIAVLPLADFSNGLIELNAAGYSFFLKPETVRNGGVLKSPVADAVPEVTVRLRPANRAP